MAHVAKYTQAQSGHMLDHYNRHDEPERERSNKSIDKDDTPKNYNLMEREQAPSEFLADRLSEVWHMNRDDLNVMADWVVSLPQGYQGDTRAFFEATTEFLNSRYGAENCVGAWVHMDEKNPHLHYSFVPVCPDNNPKHEQSERLNAKEVINREDLRTFHPDLQEHLRDRLHDRELTIYSDDKERIKSLSMREFKAFTEEQRVDRLERTQERREIDIEARERDTESRLERDNEYRDYFAVRDEYCREMELTEGQYAREVYYAEHGRGEMPLPEMMNPERGEDERREIAEHYRETFDRELDHEHDEPDREIEA